MRIPTETIIKAQNKPTVFSVRAYMQQEAPSERQRKMKREETERVEGIV